MGGGPGDTGPVVISSSIRRGCLSIELLQEHPGTKVSPCSSGKFRILLTLAIDLPIRHLLNSSSLLFWPESRGFFFSFVPFFTLHSSFPPFLPLFFFSFLSFFPPPFFPAPSFTVSLFSAYACWSFMVAGLSAAQFVLYGRFKNPMELTRILFFKSQHS